MKWVFNKFYLLLNSKWFIPLFIYGVSLWIGYEGFHELLSSTDEKIKDEPFYEDGAFFGSLAWAFINSVVGSTDDLKNWQIVLSQALAYVSFTIAIFIVIFKDYVNSKHLNAIAKGKHSLVIGLGQNNRQYLESEEKENNHGDIIIIETDEANPYIEDYRRNGFGVYVGTFESFLKDKLISSTWSYGTKKWIDNRKIVRCLLYYRKLKWINIKKIVISLKKFIQKVRSSKYQLKENYFINLERIMIATGNDRININLATKLADCVPDKQSDSGRKVIVHMHVENFDYNDIFYEVALKEKQLEFKPFSFNDDTARQLFEDHTVLGNFRKLVDSNEAFSVAIVGSGNLAERVIYHLCLQANLPNKNRMDIHCVSQDADQFIKRLRTVFYGMKDIEENGVTLHAHPIHFKEPEFYTFFNEKNGKHEPEFYGKFKNKKENLTNVFICFEDEDENLECAVDLYDNVFRKEIIANDEGKTFDHFACDETNNQKKCTKILFAAYNNMKLSEEIHGDKKAFNNFKSFGDSKIISSRLFRVDEKYDSIAKLINAGYINGFENISEREKLFKSVNLLEIEDKWNNIDTLHKRQSNRSQALHINTKLMAMGFRKEKRENKDQRDVYEYKEKLFEHNESKFKKIRCKFTFALKKYLESLDSYSDKEADKFKNLDEYLESLKPYSDKEADKSKINDFFEFVLTSDDMISKLARAEHERWNTFHYLEGWEKGERNDPAKVHNCLKSFDKFNNHEEKRTIVYDVQSVLDIPFYLAHAEYEIVPDT